MASLNALGLLVAIHKDIKGDSEWKCSTSRSKGWKKLDFNDSGWPVAKRRSLKYMKSTSNPWESLVSLIIWNSFNNPCSVRFS